MTGHGFKTTVWKNMFVVWSSYSALRVYLRSLVERADGCFFFFSPNDHVSDINMAETRFSSWPALLCCCSLAQALIPCYTSALAAFHTTQ